MLPTLSPQDFVAKWRKVVVKETASVQSSFFTNRMEARAITVDGMAAGLSRGGPATSGRTQNTATSNKLLL